MTATFFGPFPLESTEIFKANKGDCHRFLEASKELFPSDDMNWYKENTVMDLRRNIRAGLRAGVSLQGTDQWGKPFDIAGDIVDFSRKGLGLVLSHDVLAPGSAVTINIVNKLRSSAVVQWTRQDFITGKNRVGIRLIKPKASMGLRIAASVLLIFAVMTQLSLARSRNYTRARQSGSCVVSLAQMKSIIEMTLSKYTVITESEKAFVHIQHQHMSCDDYTRLYEKSDFYPNPKTREAIANWHRKIYHAKEAAVRENAVHSAELSLGLAQ